MTRVCPRPCGRLATAAIFIAVGVVQLVAGIFLLKSKYVYLISAPDFWTAFSNIAVGGLLGMSAGVWNNTSKKSTKHAVRRKVLAALVSSAILINSTTSVIFILGKGNSLLSIHLENNGIYTSATLASEILAYAYAASVCSPVLCIVAAIIFLSGMCFPKGSKNLDIRSISKNGPSTCNWVYKTKRHGLPTPDPEIVRKVLFLRSLLSSDDSSSSTDSPIYRISKPSFYTSLTRGIDTIETPNHTSPQAVRHCFENLADMSIPRNGNRISFADVPLVNGSKTRKVSPGSESFDQSNFQRFKMKKGDLYELGYDNSRNFHENEELQNLEGIHGIYHRHDASIANTSIASDRGSHKSSMSVSKKTECLSPDEIFSENLRCYEHKKLRRTSTANSLVGIPLQNMSGDPETSISSPSESFNYTKVQKTISWKSDNPSVKSSECSQHDQLDLPNDSRSNALLGDVIPIQVHTFPRKKFQTKLIPVSIPVVSKTKIESVNNLRENKFDDPRKGGFSSFQSGRHMKNRSKSTESYSTRHSISTSPTIQNISVSEAPLDDTNLQPSPHTSGYISAIEDIVEPPCRDSSKSLEKTLTSNSPSSSEGSGSSGYRSVKRKIRDAYWKMVDSGRPLSKKDAINDILEEQISESPLLSSKDAINELFYNLLLKKVTHKLGTSDTL